MESESKNESDLLQQLKTLQAEKKLLEKRVSVLNECLSTEELKIKITNLEKKKEMIIIFEKAIEQLRTEIEPLQFLKYILEKKKKIENQTNNMKSRSSNDLESNSSLVTALTDMVESDSKIPSCKLITAKDLFDSTQTLLNDKAESRDESNSLFSSQELVSANDLFGSTQTPTKSNSVSSVNDGSIDECMQLLDQYDIVTDQEMLNILNEKELKTKTPSVEHEPTTSKTENIDNKVQDQQTATSSTSFDGGLKNIQLENEKKNTSIKSDTESTVNIDLVTLDTMNADSKNIKLSKASSSQLSQSQESLCSDRNVSIGDLLLKIPQLLLEQEIEAFKDEIKSNESFKVHGTVNNDDLKTKKETSDSVESSKSSHCDDLLNTIAPETPINSFNDMNLKIDILRGIYSLGFVNPTVLQQRVVVHCVNGRDVIVFAGPSNGRTLMFTIPLLQRINTNINECQALVLVPTRDLAIHVKKIIMSVGDFLGINVCVGGDNVPRKLAVIPHVVVGTPFGVTSMISCNSLRTECIQTVVLNKVEKMLTPQYTKLIEVIMGKLVENKQVTLLTSDKLDQVLDVYMDTLRDPLVIFNENNDKEIETIKGLPQQFYFNILEELKLNAFCEINETLKIKKAIIFCNTLDRAQKLCGSLQELDYAVSLFHLEMSALDREQKLAMFSSNDLRMLITTDPIKGSQFQRAAWIINYDLPINSFCYLNRVAKCAENIKVINLINEKDGSTKLAIETHCDSYMIQMPLNIVDSLQY